MPDTSASQPAHETTTVGLSDDNGNESTETFTGQWLIEPDRTSPATPQTRRVTYALRHGWSEES